jgi:hypothetical protein
MGRSAGEFKQLRPILFRTSEQEAFLPEALVRAVSADHKVRGIPTRPVRKRDPVDRAAPLVDREDPVAVEEDLGGQEAADSRAAPVVDSAADRVVAWAAAVVAVVGADLVGAEDLVRVAARKAEQGRSAEWWEIAAGVRLKFAGRCFFHSATRRRTRDHFR